MSQLSVSTAASAAVGGQCDAYVTYAVQVYQSIGNVPEVCDVNGEFASALSVVYSCTSKFGATDALSSATILDSALLYCRAPATTSATTTASVIIPDLLAYVSLYSICESDIHGVVTLVNGNFQCDAVSNTTSQSSVTPSSPSPSSTTSLLAPTSSSAVASSSPRSISTGAIAGIAVGAAIGGMLLFGFVLFFIWKRRQKRKSSQSIVSAGSEPAEKPQLHSDHLVSKREELDGEKLTPKARTVGSLTELEHQPYSLPPAEMDSSGNGQQRFFSQHG